MFYSLSGNKTAILIVAHANITDPIAPEKVLLGLILVSLGPLKIFPKTKPPISEAIHPVNKRNKRNFNCTKLHKEKKV